jgi:hypothetical protein
VLDDAYEDVLDRLLVPGVAQHDRYVLVEVEGLPYVLLRVTDRALEAVDADEERYGAPLEVVDGGEAVLQATRVGEDDGSEGAPRRARPT